MTMRRGELLAAISAVALFLVMFLKWYGFDLDSATVEEARFAAEGLGDVSAWKAFDFIDIGLLVMIVVVVGLFVIGSMGSDLDLPVAGSAIIAGLGSLATLLLLFRAVFPPEVVLEIEETTKAGAVLGVIACAGIAAGGLLAMRDEGTSFAGEAARLGSDSGGDEPPSGGGSGGGEPPSSPA